MKSIYADNSSTSFPKAPTVAQAIYDYISYNGASVHRSSNEDAYQVERLILETRQQLQQLLGGPSPKYVIFTPNVTTSLNMVLQGLFSAGDHLLISSLEHNAVMRPLHQLSMKGVSYSTIPSTHEGKMITTDLESLILPNTKAILLTHVSNVCGTIQPIAEIGSFCKEHNLLCIVDTAQSAGILPIHMKDMNIDVLCFTGHKGLLGPQGIGGFLLTKKIALQLTPILTGGTGSFSHLLDIPTTFPDRLEPGTPNIPGIIGLHASLSYLNSVGISTIYEHEMALTRQFLSGLQQLPNYTIHGIPNDTNRTAVISLSTTQCDPAELAYNLEQTYHIITRVGLHCAPTAHRVLGTYPTGTVRFSFGYHTTPDEVDTILNSLELIQQKSLL